MNRPRHSPAPTSIARFILFILCLLLLIGPGQSSPHTPFVPSAGAEGGTPLDQRPVLNARASRGSNVPPSSLSKSNPQAAKDLDAFPAAASLLPSIQAGPSLAAYWKFDEGGTTTAADDTGNGNTGTLSGPVWGTGKIGAGALSFDGVNDRVSMTNTASITSISNNFTLAFWVEPRATHQIDAETTTGGAGVAGQRYVWGPNWFNNAGGGAGAGVSVGTNGVSVYEHAANYMPAPLVYQASLTGWTHVAVVYENKQPKLYVNGALVRTGLTSPRTAVGIIPWGIGGADYGYLDGQLDDLRLYNVALTAGEIAALADPFNGCLLVVGSTTLSASDAAIKARLEALGFAVTVRDAVSAATSDASGKALVFISESVLSTNVNTKFKDVNIPVVVSEYAIFDDMGMTGPNTGVDLGMETGQTQAVVVEPTHPLAGGLAGTVTIGVSPLSVAWGRPTTAATKVVTPAGDASKWLSFGYEGGAAMVGMNAPARRVATFLNPGAAASLSPDGWTLFDATIRWASGKTVVAPAAPTGLTATAVSAGQINLTWVDNSSNETKFYIERKVGVGGAYAYLATVGADVTTYSDTGLTSSTQYTYRVLAAKVGRGSGYSNERSATTLNVPPTVSLTAPANGAGFKSPATVNISAAAGDPDGTVAKIEFFANGTKLGEDTTNPYGFTWSDVAAGSYSLTAKATDNGGASTTSSAVSINVEVPGPTSRPPTLPHALSLDGTNDYVRVPSSSSLNITGPITIEAWVKRNPGANQAIVERYGHQDGGYALRIEADKVCFYTLNNAQDFDRLVSNSVVSTGVWHHLVAVFDGSEKKIFIDGVLDTSSLTSFGPGTGTAELRIGVAGDSDVNFFSGLIDEVRVTAGVRYAMSFTPDRAQCADGSDARGLWNFETQTAHDSSGKDNHGTFIGGTYCVPESPAEGKSSTEWMAAQAQAMDQPVIITFDNYSHGTTITNQYSPAIFSSGPGQMPVTYNPRSDPDDGTAPISLPNTLTRYNMNFPAQWNHFAPLTVEFTRPVNNLRFGVVGIDALWGRNIFDFDIYQNGVYKGTRTIASLGNDVNMMVNVGQPSYQFGINEITKIVIYNITDPFGIAFDDVTFDTPALRVDIKNPRVNGSLNGTTQKALAGADIVLQAVPSFSGGSYSWTFTGPAVIVGGSQNSSSVTIRSNNNGNIAAKVSYTRGGSVVSETVNISAMLPSLSSYSAVQEQDFLDTSAHLGFPCEGMVPGDVRWQLGCPPGGPGIVFTASVNLPLGPYLTDPSATGIKYVQSVSAMRKVRRDTGTVECLTGRVSEDNVESGWSLDDDPSTGNGDPYSSDPQSLKRFSEDTTQTITTEDSPISRWARDILDARKNDDRFQMYVVYFTGHPRTPIFQRRLASLSWSWKGAVVYDIAAFNPSQAVSVPYKFIERSNSQKITIPKDSLTSTLIYSGLNSSNTIKRCPLGPPPVQNPIDSSRFFVNQHYLDFLNRASDQGGSNFWTSNITPCGFDAACIERKRVDVSRAFFYSGEFINQVPALAESNRGTDSYNREFVRQCYMRYFPHRTCSDPEVCDPQGFSFWVSKLNGQWPTMGDGAYDEMMKAFIISIEYRQRFGPP